MKLFCNKKTYNYYRFNANHASIKNESGINRFYGDVEYHYGYLEYDDYVKAKFRAWSSLGSFSRNKKGEAFNASTCPNDSYAMRIILKSCKNAGRWSHRFSYVECDLVDHNPNSPKPPTPPSTPAPTPAPWYPGSN